MRHPSRVRPLVLSLAAIGVLAIGWLDYLTGPAFSFSLFYLAPIALAGWYLGTPSAMVIAMVASGTNLGADLAWNTELSVSIWNGLTSLAIFLSVAWIAARLRQDQRELRNATEREARLARTDRVTSLANSRAFLEELGRALKRSRVDQQPVCLFFIDLDEFKSVNDQFGHAAGDDVLQKVAEAIVHSIRPEDLAARLGGDEFGVLARNLSAASATNMARRILDRIREVAAEYPAARLGATIGVAYAPVAPAEAEELMRAADAAMYHGKQNEKGTIEFRELTPD